MKHLMYLVKDSSWDDDEENYSLKSHPPQYNDYKTVVIEVVEENSSLKKIMGR